MLAMHALRYSRPLATRMMTEKSIGYLESREAEQDEGQRRTSAIPVTFQESRYSGEEPFRRNTLRRAARRWVNNVTKFAG